MEIKNGLEISSTDFWYDLTDGGYLKPDEICKNQEDASRVNTAISIIEEFKQSCEEQIEGFIQ